jgi:hypothetical protein
MPNLTATKELSGRAWIASNRRAPSAVSGQAGRAAAVVPIRAATTSDVGGIGAVNDGLMQRMVLTRGGADWGGDVDAHRRRRGPNPSLDGTQLSAPHAGGLLVVGLRRAIVRATIMPGIPFTDD